MKNAKELQAIAKNAKLLKRINEEFEAIDNAIMICESIGAGMESSAQNGEDPKWNGWFYKEWESDIMYLITVPNDNAPDKIHYYFPISMDVFKTHFEKYGFKIQTIASKYNKNKIYFEIKPE